MVITVCGSSHYVLLVFADAELKAYSGNINLEEHKQYAEEGC